MSEKSSQNQNYIEFDGICIDPKFSYIVQYLKSISITTRKEANKTALLSHVKEWGYIQENANDYVREFRTLINLPDETDQLPEKSNDALGTLIPDYTLFSGSLRTACSKHNIQTLNDLLRLPSYNLSTIFHDAKEIINFVETVRALPISALDFSDISVNILHRNGINTAAQLALTSRLFLTQLPGLDGSFINKALDSLRKLPDITARYKKFISKGEGSTGGTRPKGGSPPPPKPQQFPISFDNAGYTLYVYKYSFPCRYKKHNIIPGTGELIALDGTSVLIKIEYCTNCNKCFIDFDEYERYRKKYGQKFGILLGNISFDEKIFPSGSGFSGLAEKSVLRLCGYTVNQQDDLTENQRHRILGIIMDYGILNKEEIISHLKLFIKSRKNNPVMRNAVQKWEDDWDWVSDYKIDRQKKYRITDVKKYG